MFRRNWAPGHKVDSLIDNKSPRSSRVSALLKTYRLESSLDDIYSLLFWKAVLAEFLGTFFLVAVTVGSTVQDWLENDLDVVQIALTFGLCVAIVVWIIGRISGGHINPAVTIAMMTSRRISLVRAVLYMASQCVGAILGAGVIKILTPSARHHGLGVTTLNVGVTPAMGFGIEMAITMLLVLVIFATCDKSRTDLAGSTPLTVGMAVTAGHLWAAEKCGSSMNPARSIGPAVVTGVWTDHWVYWLGPITGAIIAAFLYDFCFAPNASREKARAFLLDPDFNNDDYPKKTVIKVVEDECQSCQADAPAENVVITQASTRQA